MKKLLTVLGVAALLAGCASQDRNNGMGGTSDQSDQDTMKTDSIHNNPGNGTSQFDNNATQGTGSVTAPNNATSTPGTDNNNGTPQP
jgi:hypothetical protein